MSAFTFILVTSLTIQCIFVNVSAETGKKFSSFSWSYMHPNYCSLNKTVLPSLQQVYSLILILYQDNAM